MTNPELHPQEEQELRRLKEAKSALPIAPIDESANEFVQNLVEQEADSAPEFVRDGTAFISKLVGWSSKDADAETGCIPIASFSHANEKEIRLDALGMSFLTKNPNVNQRQVVSDDHIIDRFDFHQARKNGSVREVTVFRKDALVPTEASQIDYYLKFEDVGHVHPQQDTLLALARMHLEGLGRGSLALATQTIEVPFDMVRSVGNALGFGRPGSSESDK